MRPLVRVSSLLPTIIHWCLLTRYGKCAAQSHNNSINGLFVCFRCVASIYLVQHYSRFRSKSECDHEESSKNIRQTSIQKSIYKSYQDFGGRTFAIVLLFRRKFKTTIYHYHFSLPYRREKQRSWSAFFTWFRYVPNFCIKGQGFSDFWHLS